MPLPDDVPTFTLVAEFPPLSPDGAERSGTLTFTPVPPVLAAPDAIYLGVENATLNASGGTSKELIANDAFPGEPFIWRVDGNITGQTPFTTNISVPASAGTVNLGALADFEALPTDYVVVIGPQGPAGGSTPSGPAAGDLSGTYPNPTLSTAAAARFDAAGSATTAQSNAVSAAASALSGHASATTGVHGIADTSALVVTSDSRLTNSRTPSGSAGGDLGGTFPSPTVAKVNGVGVTGTPSAGYVPTATSGSAATWQALPVASASTAGIVRVDGTAADIQPVGSAAAAGSTGQAADAGHVHAVDTLLPGDSGLSWWNFPSINAGGATVPSATNVPGKLTLARAVLHRPCAASKFWFGVSANDAGATFLNCYAGIYSVSGTTGTLVASTADFSSSLHVSGVYSPALSPTGTLAAGEYFVAWLMGATCTWTTWNLKSSLGGITANAGVSVPHLNLSNLGSGLSALPATIDLTTMNTALITGGWGSQWYGLS